MASLKFPLIQVVKQFPTLYPNVLDCGAESLQMPCVTQVGLHCSEGLWDWGALGLVVAFTALQGALYHIPFGKVVEGKAVHNGKPLQYNINGLHAFVVTLVILGGLWCAGVIQGSLVSSRILQIVNACTALSLVISVGLHLRSLCIPPEELVDYGDKSNFLQEFALGREANPRFGQIDLKQFAMVRIGFIGWAVVDLSYLLADFERKETPSLSLLLVVTFQLIYILDFLIDEVSVLPTKEYTEDGIGFIMIHGEYMWIPFFNSLPAYYLLNQPSSLSLHATVPTCLLFGFGFLVYYLSNDQKDGFRRNPDDHAYAHLETIPTHTGQKLLASGWFGWVRHPNYLGDIVLTLAWCLPCGFSSLVPYLPALHCFSLLRRRAAEIEEECHLKYGGAWEEYCRRVPHKLIPHVY
nr:PREDICTED: delta(14)-sterol reductase-like [Lepisosteus oculatus]